MPWDYFDETFLTKCQVFHHFWWSSNMYMPRDRHVRRTSYIWDCYSCSPHDSRHENLLGSSQDWTSSLAEVWRGDCDHVICRQYEFVRIIIFKPYCATSRISKEIFILSAWQKSGVFLISSEHKNVGDIFTIVSLMYLKSFADVMCWIIFMNQAFFGKLKKLILEKMPFFC